MEDAKKVISDIKQFLNSEKTKKYFSDNNIRNLRRGFDIMEEHVITVLNEKEVIPDNSQINNIDNSVKELLKWIALTEIDDCSTKFIEQYCLLVKNWNKIGNSQIVQDDLDAISNVYDLFYRSNDLVDLYKELYNEARYILYFNPPSFEIKKEYLKGIHEKYEGGIK
jgi:soluble cytochrome b562